MAVRPISRKVSCRACTPSQTHLLCPGGAFHGRLNPLTGRSLFETFVVPTLLYGCETWILSESHLHILESFQAEIGKRILGISKYHSNIGTRIGLHWPSVKARILCRKLTFLAKLLVEDDCLSSHVFRTLASEDVYEISIVTSSSNISGPTICSSVSRILPMHVK